MSKELFWVQVFTHQVVCSSCAGNTHMFGWMAVTKDNRYAMYQSQNVRCTVCGVYQ